MCIARSIPPSGLRASTSPLGVRLSASNVFPAPRILHDSQLEEQFPRRKQKGEELLVLVGRNPIDQPGGPGPEIAWVKLDLLPQHFYPDSGRQILSDLIERTARQTLSMPRVRVRMDRREMGRRDEHRSA